MRSARAWADTTAGVSAGPWVNSWASLLGTAMAPQKARTWAMRLATRSAHKMALWSGKVTAAPSENKLALRWARALADTTAGASVGPWVNSWELLLGTAMAAWTAHKLVSLMVRA